MTFYSYFDGKIVFTNISTLYIFYFYLFILFGGGGRGGGGQSPRLFPVKLYTILGNLKIYAYTNFGSPTLNMAGDLLRTQCEQTIRTDGCAD